MYVRIDAMRTVSGKVSGELRPRVDCGLSSRRLGAWPEILGPVEWQSHGRVVALWHDVILDCRVSSCFQIEFNLAIIAAYSGTISGLSPTIRLIVLLTAIRREIGDKIRRCQLAEVHQYFDQLTTLSRRF